VSCEVKKGETVGLFGRNGSGKATLLQMICDTLNPTGGSIQTNSLVTRLVAFKLQRELKNETI
jgi:lipopolysaccharide transport system ATP-binding protein